jgi:hypothetical protein
MKNLLLTCSFVVLSFVSAFADDTAFVQAHIDQRTPLPIGIFYVDCPSTPGPALRLVSTPGGHNPLLKGQGRYVTHIIKSPTSPRVCDLIGGDDVYYAEISDLYINGGTTTRRVIYTSESTWGWLFTNVIIRGAREDCITADWFRTTYFTNVRLAACGGSAIRSLGIEGTTPHVDEVVMLSNVSFFQIGGNSPGRAAVSLSGATTVVTNMIGELAVGIEPVLFRDGLGQMTNVAVQRVGATRSAVDEQ